MLRFAETMLRITDGMDVEGWPRQLQIRIGIHTGAPPILSSPIRLITALSNEVVCILGRGTGALGFSRSV